MNASIPRVGYWSGIAAAAATVLFVFVQSLQLLGVVGFPVDEILIYGTSQLIVIPFMLEILAFHHLTPADRRFWTHAALVFTIFYGIFVTANYVVQLATVIPARIAGEGARVAVLEQTPHSMFWNFDAIGYIAMGVVPLVALPALGTTGFDRYVRRAFIAHALVTPLIAIVYFYPTFSVPLLLLGLPWAITAPVFMAMLAMALGRKA